MKDFMRGLKFGTGMLVILVIGGLMTYFGIKARSDTKTTTDTEPSKLYVSNNETLTAAKRNSMTEKVLGLNNVKIKVITGTSISTNGTTVLAHGLDRTKILTVDCSYYYTSSSIFYHRGWNQDSGANRDLSFNSTSILLGCAGTDPGCRNAPIRCVVIYN